MIIASRVTDFDRLYRFSVVSSYPVRLRTFGLVGFVSANIVPDSEHRMQFFKNVGSGSELGI